MSEQNGSNQDETPAIEKPNWWNMLTGDLPLQTPTTFFILANTLDIFWTYILLRYSAIEANPWANYILNQWGFWGMIAFKLAIVAGVCILAQIIAMKKINTARAMLWVGTAIVAAVVIYSVILFGSNFAGTQPTI